MDIHYHLPGSLKYRRRSETLPVLDVELAVEFAHATVAFHHKRWMCIAHVVSFSILSRTAYRVLWHVVQPALACVFTWQLWQNTIFVAPRSSEMTSCSAAAPWQSSHFASFIR